VPRTTSQCWHPWRHRLCHYGRSHRAAQGQTGHYTGNHSLAGTALKIGGLSRPSQCTRTMLRTNLIRRFAAQATRIRTCAVVKMRGRWFATGPAVCELTCVAQDRGLGGCEIDPRPLTRPLGRLLRKLVSSHIVSSQPCKKDRPPVNCGGLFLPATQSICARSTVKAPLP
jgi:hypothetical protein